MPDFVNIHEDNVPDPDCLAPHKEVIAILESGDCENWRVGDSEYDRLQRLALMAPSYDSTGMLKMKA